MNMKSVYNEWILGEAQLYIHARSAVLVMLLIPTTKVRERSVNVAGEAWLARMSAYANVLAI